MSPGERNDGTRTSALNTEVLSAQFTRPLPPSVPTNAATVHTSAPNLSVAAAPPSRAPRRVVLWATLVALLLVAAGVGGSWWWTEYGPGSYLTMPHTTGRPLADVQAELQQLGLPSVVDEEFSDDTPAGSVTRSDPEDGASVHKRAEVQLYVSKGVDMRTVPSVVSLPRDEAEAALSEVGLQVGAISDAYSEDIPEGHVLSQGTPAGSAVRHDSSVDLVLSKGREPRSVPRLAAMSAEAAKNAVEALGLAANVAEAYSDTVPEGQVISQQTAEGSTLYRGDQVAYTVSKGPEKVAVPDVVGRQRDEARAALEGAGFTVQEESILGGFFGTVRATDPAGGTMLKKGSVVTITVV